MLVLILDRYDELLFAVLGDAEFECTDTKRVDGKLGELVSETESKISEVCEDFLNLLRSYCPEPGCGNPWSLLRVLGCNMTDQKFARATRGKIIRTNGATDRRWNLKFGSPPFIYMQLVSDATSKWRKKDLLDELFDLTEEEKGSLVEGLLRRFPDKSQWKLPSVQKSVHRTLKSLPLTTDQLERLNSELVQQAGCVATRAPGRSMVQAFRENLLAQTKTVPLLSSMIVNSSPATHILVLVKVERVHRVELGQCGIGCVLCGLGMDVIFFLYPLIFLHSLSVIICMITATQMETYAIVTAPTMMPTTLINQLMAFSSLLQSSPPHLRTIRGERERVEGRRRVEVWVGGDTVVDGDGHCAFPVVHCLWPRLSNHKM